MRYQKNHKAQTHNRIVKEAATQFRQHGLDGVGIAGLMKSLGMTNGGFYNHFASRDTLVQEAFDAALDETLERLDILSDRYGGGIGALINVYLHPQHLADPGDGCALAALGSEMARRPADQRQGAGRQVARFLDLVARKIGDRGDTLAPQVLSAMVGTLILARLAPDEDRARAILSDGRKAARQLAGLTPH
jgi:TetR/AcrR family transcriptional repressor of nem operon